MPNEVEQHNDEHVVSFEEVLNAINDSVEEMQNLTVDDKDYAEKIDIDDYFYSEMEKAYNDNDQPRVVAFLVHLKISKKRQAGEISEGQKLSVEDLYNLTTEVIIEDLQGHYESIH